jgi:hypothetical protein
MANGGLNVAHPILHFKKPQGSNAKQISTLTNL